MKGYILIGMVICIVMLSSCNSDGAKRVYPCEEDSDCVLGISVAGCCNCPGAVHKDRIDNENLFLYGSEEYRAQPMPEKCEERMCEMCPDPDRYKIKCIMQECRMVLEEEI